MHYQYFPEKDYENEVPERPKLDTFLTFIKALCLYGIGGFLSYWVGLNVPWPISMVLSIAITVIVIYIIYRIIRDWHRRHFQRR